MGGWRRGGWGGQLKLKQPLDIVPSRRSLAQVDVQHPRTSCLVIRNLHESPNAQYIIFGILGFLPLKIWSKLERIKIWQAGGTTLPPLMEKNKQ